MENKKEQIINALIFTKNILDTITVTGSENCSKLSAAYNNINVISNMIESGEIDIIVGSAQED